MSMIKKKKSDTEEVRK